MIASPRGLRSRILGWLLLYVSLLSVAIFIGGLIVNEEAERMVWRSLLHAELDHYEQRRQSDPSYRWTDTDQMRLYHWNATPPLALRGLGPGLHDEQWIEGRLCVVMVEDLSEGRVAISLDISEFDGLETTISASIVIGMLGVVLIFGLLLAWALGRAIHPLTVMAGDIAHLQPGRNSQKIHLQNDASTEMHVIADAFNDYLKRAADYVERERAFVNSASHELRTPIAVIAGAAQLARDQPGSSPVAREQMSRVLRSSRQIEQMLSLLLVLAKDPKRLAASSDEIALDELLPEIVEDHRHLAQGKDLVLRIDPLPTVRLFASVSILQTAIGNLLRNAIEHSDRGEVRVQLDAQSVTITDPGHGMSPEEVSAHYARLARGESRDGGGIGLDLIARLCEHLGWRLDIESAPEGGTQARLYFRVPSDHAS